MTEQTQALTQRSRLPSHRGAIFQMEADQQGIALVESKVESIKIYVTVIPDSAKVQDARFFTYGGPTFTAVADALCELLIGRQMSTVPEITPADVEALLRDTDAIEALSSADPAMVLIAPLLEQLMLNYPEKRATALAAQARNQAQKERLVPDDEWHKLSKEEKIKMIDDCLNDSVRQALNADGGDMEIVDIQDDSKIIIRYSGACAGCGSSAGATLFYIENQLRENVYPGITVIPENNPFGDQEDWL